MQTTTKEQSKKAAPWTAYAARAGRGRAVVRYWIKGPEGERAGHYPSAEAAQAECDRLNAASPRLEPDMEATTTLPKAKTRCGPEFAAQAYLACTKGVATQRQQKSVAAQVAVLRADKAELLRVLAFIQRGMEGGHIKCAAYFDFDPDAEQIEFKAPVDMVRDAIRKATA